MLIFMYKYVLCNIYDVIVVTINSMGFTIRLAYQHLVEILPIIINLVISIYRLQSKLHPLFNNLIIFPLSSEIYRLNLEQGRFLSPLLTQGR